ncbi:hypothetical protein [Amycolatopsis sp. CA-128772]|uniref:VMAP-C domain-containing protein n=1 Tax=Amycolatopsis sp. CA-128772 TaxID=2073159 RepID=UPI0011B02822|nr:hypothetical protein [Amycolatopsis sp. CA-128772]
MRKAVVDALVAAGFADELPIRSLLIGELRNVLGDSFTVPDQLSGRDQLVAIVNTCDRSDAMDALVDVLEFLRPGIPSWSRLRRLVSSIRVFDVVSQQQQEAVRPLLTGLRPRTMPLAARQAAGNVVPLPRFEDAWSAFCQLADLNSAPGELPPAVSFVELISSEYQDPLRANLRAWTTAQARRLRQDAALRELRDHEGANPLEEGKLHLTIVVEPDGIDAGRFEVSPWRQDDPGQWPPRRGETVLVAAADLEGAVSSLIAAAEEAWSGLSTQAALEFVLPRALLNLPVHAWATDRAHGDTRPLFLSYPVVLRSLERLSAPQYHRRWRLRWSVLVADPSVERVYFCHVKDVEERFGLDTILSDEQWVMMVLTEAPSSEPDSEHDQLFAALRAGVPVVLWHPTASTDALREVVAWLANSKGLGDLPSSRTRKSRTGRHPEPGLPFDSELLRDLVVLWDDPDRILPCFGGASGRALNGGAVHERDRTP